MQVWTTLTLADLECIARDVRVTLHDPQEFSARRRVDGTPQTRYTFTLRPVDEVDADGNHPWQRESWMAHYNTGNYRRVHAVCWHGHYAFLDRVTMADILARVKSAFYDAHDRMDWVRAADASAWRNVGSMMYPRNACEVCRCDFSGNGADAMHTDGVLDPPIRFSTLEPDGHGGARETNIRTIARSTLRACKHLIFDPDHYRPDGTCRCNDPSDPHMAAWGYTWDGLTWTA